MSEAVKGIQNPAIRNLIRPCREEIPFSEIADIKPSQIDSIHYAVRKRMSDDGTIREAMIILILVGSNETCTTTLVSEFARIYSLPTFKYNVTAVSLEDTTDGFLIATNS